MRAVRTAAVFWSASFEAATGQALVTARVARANYGIAWRMAVFPTGLRGVAGFAQAALVLWAWILSGRCRLVYLVCSRSVAGFLRDVPALAAALLGLRVVVHAHGSDLPALLGRGAIGRIATALYRRCEIIVPSPHLLVPLAEAGCSRLHLVENFALPLPSSARREQGSKFSVLWNSNVMASKGIREVVEAARIAKAHGLDLVLVILGRPIGDLEATRAEMAAYLETLSGIDWIDLRGPVSPEKAGLAVAEADLVVLPSRYPSECQPLAIIQAMCAGRKVIVSDTPALRATLGTYPGRVVPAEPGSIAQAILELATSPEIDPTIMAEAAARFDPARFDARMAAILSATSQ